MGGFSFAQTESPPEDSQEIQEEHDTKNLNELLREYSKDQEKVLRDAEYIQGAEATTDLPEEVTHKTIVKKVQDPKKLKKMKYSEAITIALMPLQKLSEKELIRLLNEKTTDSSIKKYIDQFPKLTVFTVRLIKSKDALPSLTKIADDEDRFIRFAAIMISTILFSFFLKRLMRREGRSILKAVSLWFLRFMIVSSLRLAIVLYFFSEEITPTFKIALETFF